MVPLVAALAATGCDPSPPGGTSHSEPSATAAATRAPVAAAPAPPADPPAPEIIVSRDKVDIGRDRLAAPEPGLTDKALVFLRAAPKIQGAKVDVVAMRAAKPSAVAAVLDALEQAGAAGVQLKSETRDGKTQALPVALVKTVPECTAVAWIGKTANVDMWSAGGGVAKRTGRGLAGPDLTLAMDALHKLTERCEAAQVVVGADDAMTFGLVFDLAMEALHQPWTRTSAAVVASDAVPGHKLVLTR
ncbi:MAG: hypothetical protein FWD17_02855 [Polyangiaceae bacterium]|nr:hypothetical protein [Polyangiaceae bacterium]